MFKIHLTYLLQTQNLSLKQGTLEMFEFLLINDENFLYLASIEWFTEQACNQLQIKVLNSFNKITRKWQKKLETYQKFQNFYSCSLKLGIQTSGEESCWGGIRPRKASNGKKIHLGLTPKIFFFISEKTNFKPNLMEIVNEYVRPDVFFYIFRSIPFKGKLLHM
ncbi:hypothetical protein ACKWTF_016506 [Chironomus riparius]